MRKNKFFVILFFIVFFAFVARLVFSGSQNLNLVLSKYNFGDIFGRAIAVNDSDQIMIWGSDSPDPTTWHPMFAQNGMVFKDVDKTLIGDNVNIQDANSFNNKGEFVGFVSHGGVDQGFIYDINTDAIHYMGTNFGGISAKTSTAIAINNNSQVLGMYRVDGDNCDHLVLWTDGVYKVLNTTSLGCSLRVYGMNDNGFIVGYVQLDTGDKKTFIFNSIDTTYTVITDRADVFTNIEPRAINNNNVVVGGARLKSDMMSYLIAFKWQNGNFTSLGTLPGGRGSVAYSVDDSGNIVGESDITNTSVTPAINEYHGFVYTSNNLVDLGILDTTDIGVNSFGSNSLDINNGHLIVGSNYANLPDPEFFMQTIYIPVEYDYMFTKRIKPTKLKKPHMTPTPHPSSKPPVATPSIQPI